MARVRKRNKAREKRGSKGLLDSAGIAVPDPKVCVHGREREREVGVSSLFFANDATCIYIDNC